MARKVLCALIAFMLCMGTSVFAGGVGNCVQPVKETTDHFGIGVAFEYNAVDERMNQLENTDGPQDMEVTNLDQYYGKIIFGLTDKVNVYTKIGVADYDLRFIDGTTDEEMIITLDEGLYTGGGINCLHGITDWNNFNISVGVDLQGNAYMNDVTAIDRAGISATSVDGAFVGVDGQNSLYLTLDYEIEKLKTSIVPYLGVYHSWIAVGSSKSLTYYTVPGGYVEEKDYQPAFDLLSFGLLLGLDVDIAGIAVLNIAGRLIGETAFTTGATVKF